MFKCECMTNQTKRNNTKQNQTKQMKMMCIFCAGEIWKKKSEENRKFCGANSYDRCRSEKCKRMLWCHKKFENACEIVVKICLGKCEENSNDSEFRNVENSECFLPEYIKWKMFNAAAIINIFHHRSHKHMAHNQWKWWFKNWLKMISATLVTKFYIKHFIANNVQILLVNPKKLLANRIPKTVMNESYAKSGEHIKTNTEHLAKNNHKLTSNLIERE